MTFTRRAIVVDGGAALPEDLERGVVVVPHHITVGTTEFIDDGSPDSYAAFYRLLRAGGTTATATPSPGAYLEAFRRCDADTVLCLTIPERWSGMHSTASLAAGMLADEEGRRRVTVLDTGTAVGGIALVARCAASLSRAAGGAPGWEESVRSACEQVRVYGALATLTYVARSGRVPALLAGISNTLRVRPVFKLVDRGETGRVGLSRTVPGAIRQLECAAKEDLGPGPLWIVVFHADAADDASALADRLSGALDTVRCETIALSPIFGAHTGPGTIGFAALPWPGGAPPD